MFSFVKNDGIGRAVFCEFVPTGVLIVAGRAKPMEGGAFDSAFPWQRVFAVTPFQTAMAIATVYPHFITPTAQRNRGLWSGIMNETRCLFRKELIVTAFPQNLRAVIFDMDGLLTDTERLHMRAYREAFQTFGVALSEEKYASHWITEGYGVQEYLDEIGSELSADEVRAQKSVLYERLLDEELELLPGAKQIVHRFAGRVPMAVASASLRKDVYKALQETGILPAFDVVLTADDVTRRKPDPEIFRLAAQRLGEEPQNCLVLEDAQKGVNAAHAAGMPCIVVPSAYTKNDDFSKATALFETLDEAAEWIESRLSW